MDNTPEALRSADAIEALEHKDTIRFILDHLSKLSELQQRTVRLVLDGHDWETVAQYCSDAEGKPVTSNAVQLRFNLAVNNLHGLLEMTKDKDAVYGGITPGIWLRGIVCSLPADPKWGDLLSRIYWDDVDERAAEEARKEAQREAEAQLFEDGQRRKAAREAAEAAAGGKKKLDEGGEGG